MNRSTLACAALSAVLLLVLTTSAFAYVFVKWDSPGPEFDGTSWSTAFHTIQEGINAATPGDEIWVARGTYAERITLQSSTRLLGGFAGQGLARSIIAYRTTIDGNRGGSTVTVPANAAFTTLIDGFTIRNGFKSTGNGGGIYCSYNSAPGISNNVITGNEAVNGGGISCYYGSPTLANNVISGNTSEQGSAIYVSNGSPAITGNTIVGNNDTSAGAIFGIAINGTMSSNIIAFNTSGIYKSSGAVALKRNCVYGNTRYDYGGSDLSPATDDIPADPLFVDRANGDYHLQLLSPCVNMGWRDAPGMPTSDYEGDARGWGLNVDIGADECTLTVLTMHDAKAVSNGMPVSLTRAIVTAAFPEVFYVESDDRTVGMSVRKPGHTLSVGMRADITGSISSTPETERYIEATTAVQSAPPGNTGSVEPFVMNNRAVGGGDASYYRPYRAGQCGVHDGVGLNNVGLLVTTSGRVLSVEGAHVLISDGSQVLDPTGYRFGITVSIPDGIAKPAVGEYVRATGVVSVFVAGTYGYRYPIVRARSAADIVRF